MNGKENPNRLIVEGIADTQAVLGLMRAHTHWSATPGNLDKAPVYIERGGGVSEILNEKSMKATMKTNTIRNLGLICYLVSETIWPAQTKLGETRRGTLADPRQWFDACCD